MNIREEQLSFELGLREFLVEAELEQYYTSINDNLKIQTTEQLKYITDDDLKTIGMTKLEIRRLKKNYAKYYPKKYLSKLKKLLLAKRGEKIAAEFLLEENHDKPFSLSTNHIISPDAIVINKKLGTGEFGIVQQGIWNNDGERIQVAIKCLSRDRMQNHLIEFSKEAAIMHSINHEHIVKLYGVVLDTNSLMLVTELAPLRSLLECLKEPSLRVSFPVISLCDFALQIATGMQYLEIKRLIHRDLAARNILVFSKNTVKISDFGLSRALGVGKDYYRSNFNVNLKLPIAWCAPECISYLKFTTSSDVWAYGITLWEMFSYGFQPWAALTGHEILEAIDEPNFQRLDKPDCCPKNYYYLMQKCWQHDPEERPRFHELVKLLPDLKPEQVQALNDNITNGCLPFRQGDIITVLDKELNNGLWKGVLNNGRTGLFNPAQTVPYCTTSSSSSLIRGFLRNEMKNLTINSRRRLTSDMISSPQNDLRHTGHVGADGACFGDLSFLGKKYAHLPQLVVAPYNPDNDAIQDNNYEIDRDMLAISDPLHSLSPINEKGLINSTSQHEYHEISDEEKNDSSLKMEKYVNVDLGPSLLDEIDKVFRLFGNAPSTELLSEHCLSTEHESTNVKNEIREIQSRQTVGKKQAAVKPISAADQKTLYSAIAMAQELTARSMTELEFPVNQINPSISPMRRRKFSVKLSHQSSPKHNRRHFAEEAASIPDIQATLSDEAKEVYNSLVAAQTRDNSVNADQLDSLKSCDQSVKSREKKNLEVNFGLGAESHHDQHHLKNNNNQNGDQTFDKFWFNSLSEISDKHNGFFLPTESQTLNKNSSLLTIFSNKSENLIPLPPRDRSKTLQGQSNLPRHHRKHPLIIPPSVIAKLLIDVTDDDKNGNVDDNSTDVKGYVACLPAEENVAVADLQLRDDHNNFDESIQCIVDPPVTQNLLDQTDYTRPDNLLNISTIKQINEEHLYENNIKPDEKSQQMISYPDKFRDILMNDFASSAATQEQKILQNNVITAKLSNVEDAENTGVINATPADENIKTSIEISPLSYDTNDGPIANNNGAGGVGNGPVYPELFRQSDHVSCEDLLEFAYDRPNVYRTRGPLNGPESDEVRIMLKVLHDQSTPESCITALNITNWDVLNAIKLERLRILLCKQSSPVLLENYQMVLNKYGGDILKAAAFLLCENK